MADTSGPVEPAKLKSFPSYTLTRQQVRLMSRAPGVELQRSLCWIQGARLAFMLKPAELMSALTNGLGDRLGKRHTPLQG